MRGDDEKLWLFERKVLKKNVWTRIQQYKTELGNQNECPTVPALKKRRCDPIHQRDKNRMGRPCMAGRLKYVEMTYMAREKDQGEDRGKDGRTASRNY